jgi:hypothetical protein
MAKIEKMKEMIKENHKREYAKGFIDALNERSRIDSEARKRTEKFISALVIWYQENYPYYTRHR